MLRGVSESPAILRRTYSGADAPSLDSPWTTKALVAWAANCLVVCTFLEDSLRLILTFRRQRSVIRDQTGLPNFIASLLVVAFILVEPLGIALMLPPGWVRPTHLKLICTILLGFVCVQLLAYGGLFVFEFLCLSLAHVGGLLLIYCSAHASSEVDEGIKVSHKGAWRDSKHGAWLQLAARILLTTDVAVWRFKQLQSVEEFDDPLFVLDLVMFIMAILIWLGIEAQRVANLLALISILEACYTYFPFWQLSGSESFLFFQILGIVGGLLLIGAHGAGRLKVVKEDRSL